MPYLDWGACPYECCVYGTWTVLHDTTVRTARRPGAPPAFRLKAGERVTVPRGVVVTTRPGQIRVLAPTTLGEGADATALKPGDILYTLHYAGEGYDLLWFKGRKLKDQIHTDEVGRMEQLPALEVLELPSSEWWVRVKNSAGQVGWSMRTEDFGNRDRCE